MKRDIDPNEMWH